MAAGINGDAAREFGAMLRELRSDAGKTMADVARALGVAATVISDWERGCTTPGQTNAVRYANAIGADPAALAHAAWLVRYGPIAQEIT